MIRTERVTASHCIASNHMIREQRMAPLNLLPGLE